MAQSCPQCGSICRDDVDICAFCDSPLTHETDLELLPAAGGDRDEPEWRREVTRRLEAYRRKRSSGEDEPQTPLPFAERPTRARVETSRFDSPAIAPPAAPRPRQRDAKIERVEISIHQPTLDFNHTEEVDYEETRVSPVAPVAERVRAGAVDFLFLGLVYGAFLVFFRSVGGHFSLAKLDLGILGASFFLLYASYFSIFTILGGATPGMLFSGLVVAELDGDAPNNAALVWRSIGYILSGATLFMGFLWASIDTDSLTWHDRISQTFIARPAATAEHSAHTIHAR